MSAQHTPGPWVYRRSFDSSARRDIWTAADATGHRELVATIPDADGDYINADARLIAAAPELLAALRAAEEWAEHIEDDESRVPVDVRLAMRAAIARATGGAA